MLIQSRFLHDESGASSVEAIVVLPCFLLLFFAVSGVHARYAAKQSVLAAARSCAWLYSEQGCNGELPPGCSTSLDTSSSLSPNQYFNETANGGTASKQDRLTSAIASEIGEPQRTLFGQSTNAAATVTSVTPKFLEWGQSRVSARYHLACNLKPQRLKDVLGFLWDTVK